MKSIFTFLIAVELVSGEPLVFILPSSDQAKATTKQQHGNDKGHRRASSGTKDLDFGRQLYAKDVKHHALLSDKTDKLSHKLDQSNIRQIPKKTTFHTGILDFDNPLEDIFTSKFHTNHVARRLGKESKSKSSKSNNESIPWHSPSNWHDETSSKSKSESKSPPVWNGWHIPDERTGKSDLPKSSAWSWHDPNGHDGKSSKSKSSKAKSSAWSGWHASAGGGDAGGGGAGGGSSFSDSKSSKWNGFKATSTSFGFSYQIGSYGSWSIDESRDTTPPELLKPPAPVKAPATASPVSAKPALKLVHVEPKPREDTMLVSELSSLEPKPTDTHDVSASNEHTVVYESLRSNKMYIIAGAALFGGLVTLFAAVFIKRKVQPGDTHMELKESPSQDDTEDATPSDGSHSYNLGTIQHSTTSENDETCEWSHPDSWLAVDMRA